MKNAAVFMFLRGLIALLECIARAASSRLFGATRADLQRHFSRAFLESTLDNGSPSPILQRTTMIVGRSIRNAGVQTVPLPHLRQSSRVCGRGVSRRSLAVQTPPWSTTGLATMLRSLGHWSYNIQAAAGDPKCHVTVHFLERTPV